MKKALSILLALIVMLSVFTVMPLSASAEETDSAPLTVPQIRVVTENGNGTALQKADDYVNAAISIIDENGEELSGAVKFTGWLVMVGFCTTVRVAASENTAPALVETLQR